MGLGSKGLEGRKDDQGFAMEVGCARREKARLRRDFAHNVQPRSEAHRRFERAQGLGKEQLGRTRRFPFHTRCGGRCAALGRRPDHRTFNGAEAAVNPGKVPNRSHGRFYHGAPGPAY